MREKLIGFIAVFALLLTGVYAATNTWTVPSGSNVPVTGATQTLDVSIGDNAVTNVTFYYTLSGGSQIFIAEAVNATANQTNFNVTWDTTALTDQATVTLNATAWVGDNNNTMDNSAVLTGIDIDNTVPTSTYGTANPANNADLENNTVFFLTATDASMVNCTLTTSPGINATGSSFTVAASGSTCELKVFNIPDGTYSYNWATRDNLNTSTLTTRFLTVSGVASNAVGNIAIAGAVAKKDTAIIVVLAAAALFFVFKKK